MFVARYSFIQVSELWQHGMNEITKASKLQQVDSNSMNVHDETNLTGCLTTV